MLKLFKKAILSGLGAKIELHITFEFVRICSKTFVFKPVDKNIKQEITIHASNFDSDTPIIMHEYNNYIINSPNVDENLVTNLLQRIEIIDREKKEKMKPIDYIEEFRDAIYDGIGSTVLDGKYVYDRISQDHNPYCYFKRIDSPHGEHLIFPPARFNEDFGGIVKMYHRFDIENYGAPELTVNNRLLENIENNRQRFLEYLKKLGKDEDN